MPSGLAEDGFAGGQRAENKFFVSRYLHGDYDKVDIGMNHQRLRGIERVLGPILHCRRLHDVQPVMADRGKAELT